MPKMENLTLLVLKGHLLLEELINATGDALLPNPSALKAAQLGCFQRTRRLMALIPDMGFNGPLVAFEKLNAIRNKYGHMLEPPQIEERILAFVDFVEGPMEPAQRASVTRLPERLSRAISFLCGQLEMVSPFYLGASQLIPLNKDYEDEALTSQHEPPHGDSP